MTIGVGLSAWRAPWRVALHKIWWQQGFGFVGGMIVQSVSLTIYIVTGLYNLMNKEIIFSITIGESLSDDSTSQTACMCWN